MARDYVQLGFKRNTKSILKGDGCTIQTTPALTENIKSHTATKGIVQLNPHPHLFFLFFSETQLKPRFDKTRSRHQQNKFEEGLHYAETRAMRSSPSCQFFAWWWGYFRAHKYLQRTQGVSKDIPKMKTRFSFPLPRNPFLYFSFFSLFFSSLF